MSLCSQSCHQLRNKPTIHSKYILFTSHTLGVHSSKDSNRALPAQWATGTGGKLKLALWSHSKKQLQDYWETRLRQEAARIVSSLYKIKTLLGTSKKVPWYRIVSDIRNVVKTCLDLSGGYKIKVLSFPLSLIFSFKIQLKNQKLIWAGEKEKKGKFLKSSRKNVF